MNTISKELSILKEKLKYHIIVPEIPGFGIWFSESLVQEQLYKRAERTYNCN